MIDLLKYTALSHGDKLKIVPIERLQDLKDEIKHFTESEELNNFQKWIAANIYKFDTPAAEFTIRSILLIAIPHPFYANAEFIRQGKKYIFPSLVMSDFDNTRNYLMSLLEANNYHMIPAANLPLKRLAVKSGLAVYGRNNISYVDGMGSDFSYDAYFIDIPGCDFEWRDLHTADVCKNCRICMKSCPTGAISEDRFLIDNEKCLSYYNEVPGEFPDWLPLSAHHCLYDCLKCQIKCPMNKAYVNNIIGPIEFSEDETQTLLSGEPYDTFSPNLKEKSKKLGLDLCIKAIPRNLNILIQNYEER